MIPPPSRPPSSTAHGILDSGLFLQMATTALIATDTNLKTLHRPITSSSRPTPQP